MENMTREEIIYLDDPRIRKHFVVWEDMKRITDPHPHHEPRMVGVYSMPRSWWLFPGEYVELDVPEWVKMLGVIFELASHHYRARLYVNGENITPDYLDGFCMGVIDGLGCIRWFMLPSGEKRIIRLEITDSYNPALQFFGSSLDPTLYGWEKGGTKTEVVDTPHNFCLSGFILKDNIQMPTPVFSSVSWTQDQLKSTVIPRAKDNGKIPGILEIGYIPHPGELSFMRLNVDDEDIEVDITDGWGIAPFNRIMNFKLTEFMNGEELHGENIEAFGRVLRWDDNNKSIALTHPLPFMSMLRIQLRNYNTEKDAHLISLRCIAKVRLC